MTTAIQYKRHRPPQCERCKILMVPRDNRLVREHESGAYWVEVCTFDCMRCHADKTIELQQMDEKRAKYLRDANDTVTGCRTRMSGAWAELLD